MVVVAVLMRSILIWKLRFVEFCLSTLKKRYAKKKSFAT